MKIWQLLGNIFNSNLLEQNKKLAELRQACGEGDIAQARDVIDFAAFEVSWSNPQSMCSSLEQERDGI